MKIPMRRKEASEQRHSPVELGTLFNKSHQIDPWTDVVGATMTPNVSIHRRHRLRLRGDLDEVRSELVLADKVALLEIMRNGPSVKKRLKDGIVVVIVSL